MAQKGDSKSIPQHKRMAMGYAKGGSICGGGMARAPNATPVGGGAMVIKSGGSPITASKRNNGIPAMKKGGAVVGGKMQVGGVKGRDRDE